MGINNFVDFENGAHFELFNMFIEVGVAIKISGFNNLHFLWLLIFFSRDQFTITGDIVAI